MDTASSTSPAMDPRAMEQAHVLTTLLQDSEIGAAVYDGNLRLLACNDSFRTLRGLLDLPVGSDMAHVIHASLAVRDVPTDRAQQLVDGCLERLARDGVDRIDMEDASGSIARVERRRRPDGLVVEIVNQLAPSTENAHRGHLGSLCVSADGRRQLSAALESMADGFAIFDAEGVLIAFNERYRTMTPEVGPGLDVGMTHEQIIRAVHRSGEFDLSRYTEEEFVAFATRERLDPGEPTIDSLSDGRSIRFAGRRLPNGSTIFIQSDVTEMKAHQDRAAAMGKSLSSRKAQMDSAIEAMRAGFIMFNGDSRMVMCNTAYRTMLGFPDDVLQPGVRRSTLIEVADREQLFDPRHIEQSRKSYTDSIGAESDRTFRYHMTDGRVLEFYYTPMSDGGSILLCMDITADLEAKAQLERYSQTLERSNAELQNFAYVASHDLQEPLRKIEAFGDRLTKKHSADLPEAGQVYLERIQDAATRMRQLINDLLSFSRVSSKERVLEDTQLSNVFEGVMGDLHVALEESAATVECGELPTIEADPMQMRQLFQNLLANALKFSRPGVAPVIRITAQTQRLGEADDLLQDRAFITISDNGIGFEPRFAEQIFTIFQRLHGRTEYEGTGIGLATCRKIVERHGGSIAATGTPGEGAVFTIDLPVKQPKQELPL